MALSRRLNLRGILHVEGASLDHVVRANWGSCSASLSDALSLKLMSGGVDVLGIEVRAVASGI